MYYYSPQRIYFTIFTEEMDYIFVLTFAEVTQGGGNIFYTEKVFDLEITQYAVFCNEMVSLILSLVVLGR